MQPFGHPGSTSPPGSTVNPAALNKEIYSTSFTSAQPKLDYRGERQVISHSRVPKISVDCATHTEVEDP